MLTAVDKEAHSYKTENLQRTNAVLNGLLLHVIMQ
jgi:hypothetical protein